MGEDAERKYLASLDFNIKYAEDKLNSLTTKLNKLAEDSEKLFQNMQKSVESSFNKTSINTSNIIDIDNIKQLSKGAQTEFVKGQNQILSAKQKNDNKLKLMEAETQKALSNQVKSGVTSRVAEYAKTFLIYQGFNQLKQAALDTVEAMKSVEYRMMEISRIMEEGTINVNEYRDSLIDLAYEYGRSFDEVSTVTLNLARAGYNAKDSLALTEKALLALNTAELDANQATDGLISIMAQWGLDTGTTAEKANNLANIIDKINKSADNFPISSEGLLEALKRTSQGFNLAGATIDETIALIVAAERASQRGGKVIGTAMSNITQQLKAEGKLNLAESLGLDFYEDEAQTTFKSITDIFAEMSEKMTQLKEEGKESSTEMQSLLEIFTVFRRNIGAGLLSEMEGEDSTYAQALANSLDAVGYSAQENSKYMNTATAATEQFNASLLKLQTTLWDNQGEGLFYTLINSANGAVEALTFLIEKFGALPVAIGAATLAFSLFSQNFKSAFGVGIVKQATKDMDLFTEYLNGNAEAAAKISDNFKVYSNNLTKTDVNTKGYIKSLVKQNAATVATTVATAALQATLSLGLSAAITLVVGLIDGLIHKQENLAKSNQEIIDSMTTKIKDYETEIQSIDELIVRYEELSEAEVRTPEINQELLTIQKQLKELLGQQAEELDLINGKYETQIRKIEKIIAEKREEAIINAKAALNAAESNFNLGTRGLEGDWFYKMITSSDDASQAVAVLEGHVKRLNEEISYTTDESEKANKQKELASVNSLLEQTRARVDSLSKAQSNLNNLVVEDYLSENITGKIKNIDNYKNALDNINNMKLLPNFSGTIEEQRKLVKQLLVDEYPEFATKMNELNLDKFENNFKNNTDGIKNNIQSIIDKFDNLSGEDILSVGANGTDEQKSNFEELEKYADKYNISISSLINKLIELKVIQGDLIDENYVSQIDNLKNAIYETSDSYDALSTAMNSYNQNGELTMEEVKTMLEKTPELAKYIIKVGDAYKLNEQAIIDYNEIQERSVQAMDEYIEKLKEQQFGTKDFVNTYNEFLDAINSSYDFESINSLSENIRNINNDFLDGKTTAKEYFDSLQTQISDLGPITTEVKEKLTEFNGAAVFGSSTEVTDKTKEEIEGMQAMFASFTQATVQGIEYINAQFSSGQMNFVDYSNSIQEASDNILDLYTKSNELSLVDGQWVDAAGEVDDFASNLQSAKDELESFSDILGLLGDNFDYISEHANAFGEAAFTVADEGTAAYQSLASNMTNYLNQMKDTNSEAFYNIVNDMSASTGLMTNEILNSSDYINEGLLANSANLNAAINSSTAQVGSTVGSITNSMGDVIQALGDTIAGFDYSLTASLNDFDYKDINILGNKVSIPVGLKFKITGQAGSSISNLVTSLKNFGKQLSDYKTPSFDFGGFVKPGSYSSAARPSGSGSSRGSSGGSSSRDTSVEDAAKREQEAIKEYISMFEEMIDERERLEDRWVENKKSLGLISAEDEKYILQESIKRYKTYVAEVDQLVYASEEEKIRLKKKYGEMAEDLEVEYFELLQDILDEQIDAIEDKYDEDVDAYNDAIDAKIDKIKEQADAEIEALEEVEEENDRIRQKEEYEANRNELVHGYQGVEYWQQRTGREAQLALAEAKKKVEDLDKNWEETVNKWNVEDQIKLIEERRDADIEATEAEREAYLKALEETKNAEIQALKDKYQYQLDYFNQTGQIIQDNATIQSQELFNIYKQNFIDPVGEELREALNSYNQYKASNPAPTTPTNSTITYTIQYGDTLSAIAARYGTTVDKIMAANPNISNRNLIYAGRQLRIPTSHTGSKIIRDGIVELQAGETVLNMNWAKGLDRMLGQFNAQGSSTNNITNGSTINVDGDLIKVEAKIEDKTDTAFLTRRITRELESKFNIKK